MVREQPKKGKPKHISENNCPLGYQLFFYRQHESSLGLAIFLLET